MSGEDLKKSEEEQEKAGEEVAPEKEVFAENEKSEGAKQENENDKRQSELDDLNDKYLRLYSDFENFRKRTAKERIELIESAGSDVIKELLSVLDDFERALNTENNESDESLKQGVQLIYNKLMSILKNRGLESMDSKGKEFDYELHEAITKIPASSKKEVGKIVDVVEKGYYFKGKILRYAKVVVGE